MKDEDEITFTYVQPTETRAGKMPNLEPLVSFAQRCVEEAGRHHAAEFMRAIGIEQVGETVPIDPEIAREIESMIHFGPTFHFKEQAEDPRTLYVPDALLPAILNTPRTTIFQPIEPVGAYTMTPNDYQTFALSTYCAPEHVDRHDYLMHLLFEEVGEVMSLFAKSMRDGHDVDRQTLLLELGDVLWCVACLDSADVFLWGVMYETWPTHKGIERMRAAILLVKGYDLWDVADLCACCGYTLEEVALANVAKLESRRERGVLKGSGDDR